MKTFVLLYEYLDIVDVHGTKRREFLVTTGASSQEQAVDDWQWLVDSCRFRCRLLRVREIKESVKS